MDQISTLERVFSYKAKANQETLMAMRQFDEASPAKEIAIRVLNHTYAVDRIFAANLTGTEHGYTVAKPGPCAIAGRTVRGDQDQRSVVHQLCVTS